jgi:predicted  nucleic acid-binding Zn-ribbon protein
MHDEKKYPTLRFLKCKNCGNVFAGNMDLDIDCPECSSVDFQPYHPVEDENGDTESTG